MLGWTIDHTLKIIEISVTVISLVAVAYMAIRETKHQFNLNREAALQEKKIQMVDVFTKVVVAQLLDVKNNKLGNRQAKQLQTELAEFKRMVLVYGGNSFRSGYVNFEETLLSETSSENRNFEVIYVVDSFYRIMIKELTGEESISVGIEIFLDKESRKDYRKWLELVRS